MAKIVVTGTGGVVYPLRLVGDLLSFPALQDATYALMDLDAERAERTAVGARDLAAHYGFPATFDVTDDRRVALDYRRGIDGLDALLGHERAPGPVVIDLSMLR